MVRAPRMGRGIYAGWGVSVVKEGAGAFVGDYREGTRGILIALGIVVVVVVAGGGGGREWHRD